LQQFRRPDGRGYSHKQNAPEPALDDIPKERQAELSNEFLSLSRPQGFITQTMKAYARARARRPHRVRPFRALQFGLPGMGMFMLMRMACFGNAKAVSVAATGYAAFRGGSTIIIMTNTTLAARPTAPALSNVEVTNWVYVNSEFAAPPASIAIQQETTLFLRLVISRSDRGMDTVRLPD
jgi:hypothetical protein